MTVEAISFASLRPRKSPIKENILNALIAGAFKRLSLSTHGGGYSAFTMAKRAL
jgi:hypothetical protein